MSCLLASEKCIYSHELGNSKISVGDFDEGRRPSDPKRGEQPALSLPQLQQKRGIQPSSSREPHGSLEKNALRSEQHLSRGSSNDQLKNVMQQQNSIELTSTPSRSSSNEDSSQRFPPATLTSKNSRYSASHSVESLKRRGKNRPHLKFGKSSKSEQPSNDASSEESDDDGSPPPVAEEMKKSSGPNNSEEEEAFKTTPFIPLHSRISDKSPTALQLERLPKTGGGFSQSSNKLAQVKNDPSSLNIHASSPLFNEVIASAASLQATRSDEIYLSFTDLEGVVVLKKIIVLGGQETADLAKSFASPFQTESVDLGITASYCKFVKCMSSSGGGGGMNGGETDTSSAVTLSKKQQKKQVKFQRSRSMFEQLQKQLKTPSSVAEQEEDANAEEEEHSNSKETVPQKVLEVSMNLVVSNLMGEVLEFKNIPLQSLKNPVAFPTIDTDHSGVTGLCIKSIDSLEILVSYFDGSLIFFDLNEEDAWNLKLSQPLNSNHFGVFYETTFDAEILVLVSDDTIQIYELNSYHIN